MNKTTAKENTMSKKFGVCAPMGFAFYFFVSWLITVIFTLMKKRLSFIENSFVYLLILIISINFSWIISAELRLVTLSMHPLDYTAFMIHRSIGIPFIHVVTLNLIKGVNSIGKSLLIAVCSIVILVMLVKLGAVLDITHRVKWNIINDFIYFAFLQLIAFYSLKFFRKSNQSEEISR
ncbi:MULTISPECIES: hypothetical protein [unclassified Bacillus (in: firmicutes)]|uniref:hypothetical protein n=1 Tax=unclassified Bacillus (in: firmicutes) TaxID=185979 RepID=UPI0020D26C9F|nr:MULTISPECIES: hypothetical protein [unclassified Bacillus (in: firmicutes)]